MRYRPDTRKTEVAPQNNRDNTEKREVADRQTGYRAMTAKKQAEKEDRRKKRYTGQENVILECHNHIVGSSYNLRRHGQQESRRVAARHDMYIKRLHAHDETTRL